MLALVKKHQLLIGIVFLSAILRLYSLNQVPLSLDWDEVATGWNAKTIFHTRRDEFGTLLPLSFKSFGDFKAPVYIYLTAPIVGLFGSSAFTVRLLSALAGVTSVLALYFIARQLFPKHKSFALISALLLAITPWHLLMSRPAFEPNLALAFILLNILFFLKGLYQGKYLIVSAIFFALSLYTYHSPKIFLPLFLLPLLVIFRKKLFSSKLKNWTLVSAVVALILLLPLAKDVIFQGSSSRFQGTSIFYTRQGELQPASLSLAGELTKNYFIHFSPAFLFLGGDQIPRIQMRQVGLLLLIQAPFLIWGLLYLIKNRRQSWAKLLLWWLIVGPIPAMIGFETPHPIRAYNLLPALTIVSTIGFKQLVKPSFQKVVVILFLINTIFFIYRYFIIYPVYSASDWQYGYKQAAQIARNYEDQVEKIIFTSHYGHPHIFTYFYQNREPKKVFWGAMRKYLFRDLDWDADQDGIIENGQELTNLLLIGAPEEIPESAAGLINTINFPDGSPVFRIVKTKGIK